MTALPAAPGVVLAVWESGGLAMDVVRAGEALAGEEAVAGHVIVVTHADALGRWIGIQGQPGGVGLADCTPHLADSRTRGNYAQVSELNSRPGFGAQLATFLGSCAKSLGLPYDWAGIAEDTLAALRLSDLSAILDPLWRWPARHDLLPGHVVCSSLAAMLYDLPAVGWAHPDLSHERTCMPSDWWQWSDQALWKAT
jgi:hypothetical protein